MHVQRTVRTSIAIVQTNVRSESLEVDNSIGVIDQCRLMRNAFNDRSTDRARRSLDREVTVVDCRLHVRRGADALRCGYRTRPNFFQMEMQSDPLCCEPRRYLACYTSESAA